MKIFILLLLSLNLFASGNQNMSFDHTHVKLTQILSKHLVKGKVSSLLNYKAIKEDPSDLNHYLKSLESVSPKEFENFNQYQKLSFWINAYNAYTIKLVVSKYPVKSIKEIKTLDTGWSAAFKKLNPVSSPWKIEFIKLMGKTLSLDNIEHDIIRKEFNEPRIHFAVNCASMGCPSLLPQAFNSKNIEALLYRASLGFFNNLEKNSFDMKNKIFNASKILKWYGSDFDKKYGGFVKFIKSIKPELKDLENYKIVWNDYGWDLNEQK